MWSFGDFIFVLYSKTALFNFKIQQGSKWPFEVACSILTSFPKPFHRIWFLLKFSIWQHDCHDDIRGK